MKVLRMVLHLILMLVFVACFGLACSSDSIGTRARDSAAKKTKKAVNGKVEDDEALSSNDEGEEKKDETAGEEGDDDISLSHGAGDSEIEYPTYTLVSKGYTTYTMDDHLDMTMKIQTTMSAERVTVDAQAAKVLCGKLGGCSQSKVDKDVAKNVLGAHVFEVVPRDSLKDMPEYKDARFAFFSKSFKSKRGIQFTADKPIPINILPGSAARYDALDNGPLSWTAHVTSDKPLPKYPGSTLEILEDLPEVALKYQAVKAMTVTIKVTKLEESDGSVKINLETTIAEDNDRLLYTYFPVSRSSTYTFDTKAQDLFTVSSIGWANGKDSSQEEETHLEHRACAKSVGGEVKRDDCP